jgi:hypothetical protein
MGTSNHTDYAGLLQVEGIRLRTCALSRHVVCPFCRCDEVALLSGRVIFEAKMSGEIVSEEQSFAAFICTNSHLFLVREQDVLPAATKLRQ